MYCYNPGQLFQDRVQQFSDRTAIAFSPTLSITYRQLDSLSNQLARFLLDRQIRKGDRVGFCMEKCTSAYALILACLKIGAPYFALDPKNPPSRLQKIIQQCYPSILFIQNPTSLPEMEIETIACPAGAEAPTFCDSFDDSYVQESNLVTGSDPAYIMFTSGSTGAPKGAVMSHDNLLHFIHWASWQYQFTPEDIHTHLNPLYFDNSVFDMYSTLFTGGTLVPFEFDTLQSPGALASRLAEMNCTIWFSVPSLLIFSQVMKIATPQLFGSLRKIIFGGEGYPKSKLKELMETLGPEVEFHNVYGPTECTCICSTYLVTANDVQDEEGFPPLGSLIPNFTHYILDEDNAVKEGETGELCLGGPCRGLGYYNQPEITQRVFVQNPLNTAYREIIYRTGDLVRFNPEDQRLYFVGRKDYQVKHMGYRIELEEIQHAINQLPNVDESAVLYKQAEPGEIVAVIASTAALVPNLLKKEIAQLVPKYMVPTKIHIVEQLPKNANGKTDRHALSQQFIG